MVVSGFLAPHTRVSEPLAPSNWPKPRTPRNQRTQTSTRESQEASKSRCQTQESPQAQESGEIPLRRLRKSPWRKWRRQLRRRNRPSKPRKLSRRRRWPNLPSEQSQEGENGQNPNPKQRPGKLAERSKFTSKWLTHSKLSVNTLFEANVFGNLYCYFCKVFVRGLQAHILQRVSPETFFVRICDSIKRSQTSKRLNCYLFLKIYLWTFIFNFKLNFIAHYYHSDILINLPIRYVARRYIPTVGHSRTVKNNSTMLLYEERCPIWWRCTESTCDVGLL